MERSSRNRTPRPLHDLQNLLLLGSFNLMRKCLLVLASFWSARNMGLFARGWCALSKLPSQVPAVWMDLSNGSRGTDGRVARAPLSWLCNCLAVDSSCALLVLTFWRTGGRLIMSLLDLYVTYDFASKLGKWIRVEKVNASPPLRLARGSEQGKTDPDPNINMSPKVQTEDKQS